MLHRDIGPVSRYLGPWVAEPQLWQDPVPAVDHELVDESDVSDLKATLLDSGLTVAQLASTAWASAASFRTTDKRGGANGARLRLEPQRSWVVNQPDELAVVLPVLERIQQEFNDTQSGDKRVSLADVIVLGGAAAVEKAARDAGHDVTVPFTRVGPMRPRSRPMSSRSGCSSPRPTGSAATCGRARSSSRSRCCSTAPTCWSSVHPS